MDKHLKSPSQITIRGLVRRPAEVRASTDGSAIEGLATGLGDGWLEGDQDLLEYFANMESSTEGVRRFTKKYGLFPGATYQGDPDRLEKPGDGDFSISTQAVLDAQNSLRNAWSSLVQLQNAKRKHGTNFPFRYSIPNARGKRYPYEVYKQGFSLDKGDYFFYSDPPGILFFGTRSLLTLILLTFHTFPSKDLKICENLKCAHLKFFISSDSRQKTCSQGCADAMRRTSKLKWWNTKGKKRSSNRRNKHGKK